MQSSAHLLFLLLPPVFLQILPPPSFILLLPSFILLSLLPSFFPFSFLPSLHPSSFPPFPPLFPSSFTFFPFFLPSLPYLVFSLFLSSPTPCLDSWRLSPYCLVSQPASITLVESILVGGLQLLRAGDDGTVLQAGTLRTVKVKSVSGGDGSIVEHDACGSRCRSAW